MKLRNWGMATAAAALVGAAPVAAQPWVPGGNLFYTCEETGVSFDNIAITEDGGGVRSFADGNVLIMLVDMLEPAAQSSGLVILMTNPEDELAPRNCYATAWFSYIDIDEAEARYDRYGRPVLTVPVYDYNGAESVEGFPLEMTLDYESNAVSMYREAAE